MKNLMIYTHPEKGFIDGWGGELEKLVKVQIDNSLDMGWKDIVLVTNFPYEYNGVRALNIGDIYCDYKPTVTKIYVICEMFKRGLIDDTMFFHDLDAFQLEPVNPELTGDLALTDYGIMWEGNVNNLRPSTGVMFFTPEAEDIFKEWKTENDKSKHNEEVCLLAMSHKSRFKPIFNRIQKLNITYNFATRRRNIELTYKIAEKPLKIVHFHPWDRRSLCYLSPHTDNISAMVEGNNPMGKPLVNENIIRLFKKHQII